ncbi:hypothetical protein U1Q18_034662 [Sarracenia purpurea var. burkii]
MACYGQGQGALLDIGPKGGAQPPRLALVFWASAGIEGLGRDHELFPTRLSSAATVILTIRSAIFTFGLFPLF